jgi:hypothetical protein
MQRLTKFKKEGLCKFSKTCKYYRFDSNTCNKSKGMYYAPNRPANCYKRNLEIVNIQDALKVLNKNKVKHSGSIRVMEERLKQLQDD